MAPDVASDVCHVPATDFPGFEHKVVPQPSAGGNFGTDVGMAVADMLRAFKHFKATNDERLQQLLHKARADVVTTDKLARIDKALDQHKRQIDEIVLKAQRPTHPSADPRNGAHAAAFDGYVRKGDVRPLTGLESKALSVGSEADGGYLVPETIERSIGQALYAVSPIRAISGHLEISTGTYKKPVSIGGTDAGWVGEAAPRNPTGTPRLAELTFPTMELYAMPAATLALLDDSSVNIESWLSREVQIAFSRQESAAFVTGDGVARPRGFLSYPTVAESAWSGGNLGYVASGAAGGFSDDDPADSLIDLIYALKSEYRTNGRFVTSRVTQSELRKLKDLEGNYLWQPGISAGAPAMLLGYPVSECEDMPNLGAGSLSIAFGDFQRGYLIVDRIGIRMLRDPFAAKPYVLFYSTKRVGGGVQDFDAIKLMKFAVS